MALRPWPLIRLERQLGTYRKELGSIFEFLPNEPFEMAEGSSVGTVRSRICQNLSCAMLTAAGKQRLAPHHTEDKAPPLVY